MLVLSISPSSAIETELMLGVCSVVTCGEPVQSGGELFQCSSVLRSMLEPRSVLWYVFGRVVLVLGCVTRVLQSLPIRALFTVIF
jgi:hypothetical protein